MSDLLKKIKSPEDLKKLKIPELAQLADEVRERIIEVTSRKGGHLAASLGVVELTIGLHYCLDAPKDKILWDVGHQAYAHKILTGRNKRFETLRELGGLSGFPKADESEYDVMTSGHSATSISAALGLACARDRKGGDEIVASVIGDASLATGLAFEGLNHAGHLKKRLLVILNDNEHCISKPIGALSGYLNRVITNPLYNRVREETQRMISSVPRLGGPALRAAKRLEEGLKNLVVPGILFEELGFRYFGPIDGHDIRGLITILNNVKRIDHPVLIHAVTCKGKGYDLAEKNPVAFHGVSKFDRRTGRPGSPRNGKTFTEHFSRKMLALASEKKDLVAITAAMPDGTGLTEMMKKYPERVYDVGITEPHAVTFASGLARGGMKPVIAIYSTFLQRSFDQLIHDVALQKIAPVIAIDRAGLVGEDGPTHHGMFDICYTRVLPSFVVMAPKSGAELEEMLEKAVSWDKPVAIRFPRAESEDVTAPGLGLPVEMGRSETIRRGDDASILALGSCVPAALKAAGILSKKGLELEVINARFVKPLDREMLEVLASRGKPVFTVEEGVLPGGFGEAVLDFFQQEKLYDVKIRCIGLPDEFIEHGDRDQLLRKYHLDEEGIALTIESEI